MPLRTWNSLQCYRDLPCRLAVSGYKVNWTVTAVCSPMVGEFHTSKVTKCMAMFCLFFIPFYFSASGVASRTRNIETVDSISNFEISTVDSILWTRVQTTEQNVKRNILVPGYSEVWPETQTKILKPDLWKNSWSEKNKKCHRRTSSRPVFQILHAIV